jgi:hypothetical protein
MNLIGVENHSNIKTKTKIMLQEKTSLPKWILIVSGLFALMELGVSLYLCISPESMADNVDVNAKGVDMLIYMVAARQFALGVIIAVATYKRSVPMLTLAYIFLLVMFVGDLLLGIAKNNSSVIITAIVMCAISGALLYAIIKRPAVK